MLVGSFLLPFYIVLRKEGAQQGWLYICCLEGIMAVLEDPAYYCAMDF
jgi:hypothetical protein